MPAKVVKANLTPQLPPPEFSRSLGVDMETENQALVRRIGPVAIRSHTDLAQAAMDRQTIGEMLKKIDDWFAPLCDAAFKLHRAITSRRAEVKAPLEAVDSKLRNAITAYKADEDRKRREEEARLSELRRQDEQARLAAEAAVLEQAGDRVLAEAVLEAALDAPPPVVVLPDTTKADGLSFRKVWRWRYLNDDKERALQLIPREFLCVDEARLTKYAAAMRESGKVPGIQFYCEEIAVRR